MKEWYSAAEIADLGLPDLPGTKRGVNLMAQRAGWASAVNLRGEGLTRPRQANGAEYHYSLWPRRAQTELLRRETAARKAAAAAAQPGQAERKGSREAWAWFDALPEKRKAVARERLALLEQVAALKRGGLRVNDAVHTTAEQNRVAASTLYAWQAMVEGLPATDWLPALAPQWSGRIATAACDPRAWEALKADYLRLSKPSFETCFRRLQQLAEAQGWPLPSGRSLRRRIEREIPLPVRVLTREGAEALGRLYPPQERDRSMFHALEAVNADGHKWDVFVRWPDGTVGRPLMVAIQDLYSNKLLAWRVDRSENSDAVRLAFRDVFERFGIPELAWLDNGRGFASKWITGGTPNRYRFKVKAEEPSGILTQLGVEVHWTRPYSGQSKPIERAFRDLCDAIAKHPAFEGAYTGNKPDAKPENYASRAIPLADFLRVVEQGIRLHNARPARRTRVCGGTLSFDQAFEASYAQALIRKAGPEQLRMCLLAAEAVRAERESGAVRLLGNRYWAECLQAHRGEAVTVRFDPDRLHEPVHLYRLDGRYIGAAECLEAAGFADTGAARDHNRKRAAFVKATREAAALEKQLSLDELVRLLPEVAEPEPQPPSAVRLVAAGGGAAQAAAVPNPDTDTEALSDDDVERLFARGLRLVESSRDT